MNTNTTSARQYIIRTGVDRRRDAKAPALILLRLPDVMASCGLSRSSIYQAIQRDAFPRPVKLNARRASAWIKSEVVTWMEQCIRDSRVNAKRNASGHPGS